MRHGISFFMISFSLGFCLFFGFSYFKSWFLSDWISRFSETFETLVIRDFITRFSRHSMTQFLGALTWFSSFTLSCTGRNNYFQQSVKSGIHFIIVPTQGWLHGLQIIPFHLALCKFWKEKFMTYFHFRSSSKSTYFPSRKITIQNNYLVSNEMGSTPWM